MDEEFALKLADTRLLQTLRLIQLSMADHPDQEAVSEALRAIQGSRDIIKSLARNLPDVGRFTPAVGAARKSPAA